MNKLLFVFFSLLISLSAQAQVGFGNAQRFNQGWLFIQQDNKNFKKADFDDAAWRRLDLPHDYSIEGEMSQSLASCTGYLPGGIAWYRKHFTAGEFKSQQADELTYIYFEGIYNRSEVYLNGHLIGQRPNGYASTLYELTPFLNPTGDNVLAVRVDHSRYADSRWYTGSGIYRDVWLVRAPKTHLAQWGTAYRLKAIDAKEAIVEVDIATETAGRNHGKGKKKGGSTEKNSQNLTAEITLIDATGQTVATGNTAIGPTDKQTLTLTVPNPHRWDLHDTYLYMLQVKLMSNGQVIDHDLMRAGLRTLEFDANRGFALNGRWMKVKGVCLHHDAGVLGAVVPRDVWARRLQALKEIGVNAIRMSHNPQAPVLYDLCDEMGFLVMDEASDEWEFPKRKWLEGWNKGTPGYEGSYDFFEEWIDRDVADMVRRDRNHPSIFLWSIGNEVDYPNDPYSHPVLDGSSITQPMYGGYKPEQPHAERICRIAERLSKIVRSIDSSRAVTGALAGVVMSNETAYPGAIDVVGYNYTEDRYQTDHKKYPERVIYGSENRHDMPAWRAVRDNEHIFGQFLWTGADYLGESGPWPARGSSAGLLDFGSFIKPNGHYRASLWCTHPVCYIGTYALPTESARQGTHGQRERGHRNWVSPYAQDTWNYQDGQNIRVVCYTNQPHARLLVNGQPVDAPAKRDSLTDILYWDIPYTAGTLTAEACDQLGAVTCTYEIRTAGEPTALKVETIGDNTAEVFQVLVEVVDEKGILVPLGHHAVTCEVTGPARLLGLENSDMRDTTPAKANTRQTNGGRLLAYIQPTGEQGTIRLSFRAPGLQSAETTIRHHDK
ncbi:MAG: DUF4982 domain-containing protein [Prevotella sp.]|nr:DUF4982 domain-containing protein [Prevotella sp.]